MTGQDKHSNLIEERCPNYPTWVIWEQLTKNGGMYEDARKITNGFASPNAAQTLHMFVENRLRRACRGWNETADSLDESAFLELGSVNVLAENLIRWALQEVDWRYLVAKLHPSAPK